ncbi:hypothetical protein FRC09_010923 [Ceratobasidium sp. 395]|nr:hypothetical protein FRC09_010923 [Ceratobasidium sp. 395]
MRGLTAYLCRKRYYRTHIPRNSYPDGLGDWFAAQIPREEDGRLATPRPAWIASLVEQIEQEICWRNKHNIPDGKQLKVNFDGFAARYESRPVPFQDITGIDEGMVPVDKFKSIEWSYVIDLNNRAFTINGLMHFRLDNMPPGSLNKYFWRIPFRDSLTDAHIPTFAHPPSTSIEYIATVSRWPPPAFDVSEIQKEYKKLAPSIISIGEWGAPTWSNLTTAQQLSKNLVQATLRDNAEKLSNPDVLSMRSSFGLCLWQLMCAAAPHLCCLPDSDLDVAAWSGGRYASVIPLVSLEGRARRSSCVTPHYSELDGNTKIDHKFYWFRGCLVVFCPTLNDVMYVEHETVLMINNIRKYGRTSGTGIIFSGRHMLAVAVDSDTVRCSEPLLFHDAKMNIQDGFLLATHLLGPHMTTNKTPWARVSSSKRLVAREASARKLPEELLREIVFNLDYESYQNLAWVSRLSRGIHDRYPRLGKHILLDYAGNGNYRVRDAITSTVETLYFQRCTPFNPSIMGFPGSFVYINHGPHNLEPTLDPNTGIICGAETNYKVKLRRERHEEVYYNGPGYYWSKLHLQVVHGIWHFASSENAESNSPEETEYDETRDRRPGKNVWNKSRWCKLF